MSHTKVEEAVTKGLEVDITLEEDKLLIGLMNLIFLIVVETNSMGGQLKEDDLE